MRVMIFGAGRLAAVVADVVRMCGHKVVGFVDNDTALIGKEAEPGGGRVLMNDDDFFELLDEEEPEFDAVALAVTDNKVRLRLYFELSETVRLPIFRHPSAVVSVHAKLGKGSIIMPLAVINASATVGNAVFVGAGAVIGEDAIVGDAALIGSNATVCRGVVVGERVHVGEGATVASGVSVGADSMLGSSALVSEDAIEGSRLVGTSAVLED